MLGDGALFLAASLFDGLVAADELAAVVPRWKMGVSRGVVPAPLLLTLVKFTTPSSSSVFSCCLVAEFATPAVTFLAAVGRVTLMPRVTRGVLIVDLGVTIDAPAPLFGGENSDRDDEGGAGLAERLEGRISF